MLNKTLSNMALAIQANGSTGSEQLLQLMALQKKSREILTL